jgi:hypothetical protein
MREAISGPRTSGWAPTTARAASSPAASRAWLRVSSVGRARSAMSARTSEGVGGQMVV